MALLIQQIRVLLKDPIPRSVNIANTSDLLLGNISFRKFFSNIIHTFSPKYGGFVTTQYTFLIVTPTV